MSNMKDYAMWLDDRGIATWDNSIGELVIPNGVNVNDDSLIDEYQTDSKWHFAEPDDDDILSVEEEEDEELIIDDGDLDDCAWTPDAYWFTEDGGLTGDAMNFLHTLDSQGELV